MKALIERYRNYDIILAGDFNMDLNKEAYFNDPKRIALFELANDCSLTQIIPNKIPTMTAHNGRDSSCIDMVFVSNVDMFPKPGVEDKVPWKTSCHTPISFSLVQPKNHPPPRNVKPAPYMKFSNDSLNHDIYHDTLDAYLTLFSLELIHPHSAAQISTLILKAATLQASDVHMSRPTSNRTSTSPVQSSKQ